MANATKTKPRPKTQTKTEAKANTKTITRPASAKRTASEDPNLALGREIAERLGVDWLTVNPARRKKVADMIREHIELLAPR